jgi:hypothetical protein
MKITTILIIFLTLVSCKERTTSFEEIQCSPSTTSENDNLRKVFKPCRQYIYQAKYWDSEYNLISDELIWLMATGNGWDAQPELQDEIIIQYDYDETKVDQIKKFNINNGKKDIPWSRMETTGIVENKATIFIHPFRQNQYYFTETAAFPEIRYPLEYGSSWTSDLNIREGWGDWSNTTLKTTYKILELETIDIPFKKIEAWHVRATSTAEFGNSQHDFWFNEEFGFIKMIIKNYEGQLLAIELSEVIEG